MKKVLFSATVDSHILQFHLPYLQWFKEQGYEVHVATNGNEEIPYCDVKHVVSFERSPLKINNLKAIKQMKKIIEKEKFDIIHCHTPMGSVVTRIAAMKARKKYGTRVIYTAHGFHFFKGAPIINWMMFYPVEKWLSKYTDTLITINKEDYELAKKKFKKCKDVEYVHGVGVDEEKFNFEMTDEEKHELRYSLDLKDDDFVIIYVAELSKRKNQGMLIKAVKELIDDGKTNIKVLLPGKDSMNGYYQKMAKDLNIVDNIKFLGYRKDIPKLLKISNLYVSTAKQEGLPVNIMEAMICGLPIIATDCRGNRDLVDDCIGLKETDKISEKINEVYKDKEKMLILNKTGIEKYKQDEVLIQMIKIYKKKIKVLHILASNIFSGAENVVCTIIENMQGRFDMAYCSCIGQIEDTLTKKRIRFFGINKLNIHNLKVVINEYKPDIIHAHDFKASCLSSLFSKNIKIISQIHQNPIWIKQLRFKTLIYRFCTKKFSKIIFVSKTILDEYYFKDSIKEKSKIIYNYVDCDRIINMSKEIYNKKYDLCFFGRLNREKNPIFFIKIIKTIKEQNPTVTACMIGNGELKKECLELIDKYKLNSNIELLGYCINPYKIVKNCKCVIMPSIYEGFGITAVESMILGVPVLNSGVGGLKEIFIYNKEMICFTKDNYLNMYNKVGSINNNYSKSLKRFTDKTKWKEELTEIYDFK